MRKNRAGLQKNGMRMMVLDDDCNITDALKAYFEASGYTVDTENNPVLAIEHMRETHYDILLLDFLMEPLCGNEVVERVREFDTTVYILLLTGHMELAPPLNTLRELDIQGYYEKSDRFDQLALLVESCVKSIKQMRIIRNYRDGLQNVLDLSPTLNQLSGVKATMDVAVRMVAELTGTAGALIFLRKDGHVSDYAASGIYQMDKEHFESSMYPILEESFLRASQQRKTETEQDFLLAPLLDEEERAFGCVVADALGAQNDSMRQLIGVLSHQIASALKNAALHEEVQRKIDELRETNDKLREGYLATIEAMRVMVDAKDIYTRGHSDRVAYYALTLAKLLNLNAEQVERTRVAAVFHDVGKIGVPDAVLTKSGCLDQAEYNVIRTHPSLSQRIIAQFSFFPGISEIVAAHHERMDGKGYPKGLKGDEIPMESRIIALADAYDAMTSDRHYRSKMPIEKAIAEIRKGSGTQFDARMTERFIDMVTKHKEQIEADLAWTYQNTNMEEEK